MATRKAATLSAPAASPRAGRLSGLGKPKSLRPTRLKPQDYALAIYEGQDRIGSLVERHGQPHAYDADRYHGAFLNCRKAMRAMPMTAPRHCCGQDLPEIST